MSEIPTAPQLITCRRDLERLAARLIRQPSVAVDTESNSLHAFQEQVCLIQFSTPEADYLVDPLALDDLSPLEPLFADPNVEKVFHAAEYDVYCLHRDFGFDFSHLFDTMIAARIAGRSAVGLGNLLADEFGVHTQKRFQRADWGQRPLPRALLEYAVLDTRYLLPLRDRLEAELHRLERWELAQEDFARVCQPLDPNDPHAADGFWRVRGVRDLTPRQAAVFRALWTFREEIARQRDVPPFKVISNRALLSIARAMPHRVQDLYNLRDVSAGYVRRYGEGLIEAVKHGLAAPPEHAERNGRPSDAYLARLDALKAWRKQRAREMGVESDVVLPREHMHRLAEVAPHSLDELAACLPDIPWRVQHFGAEILDVLQGIAV